MPAMNEEKTIAYVVDSVIACGYQIIVIDDASSDQTAKKATDAGAIVISHLINLGAWKATQSGLRYAKKLGFNQVVTMDADGQHEAKDIALLVAQANKGADVVIGNCIARGSTGRHVAWHFFKRLNRLNVSDITSGFRLYNEQALACLVSKQATMLEYQCIGVLLMMRNLKLNIVEVAVPMQERKTGVSRIFHSWFAVAYYLLYSGLLSLTKAFPTTKARYINRLSGLKNIE